jgi:hypothetical protein
MTSGALERQYNYCSVPLLSGTAVIGVSSERLPANWLFLKDCMVPADTLTPLTLDEIVEFRYGCWRWRH